MDETISISFLIILFMLAFTVISVLLEGRLHTAKRNINILILAVCLGVIVYETVLFRHMRDTMSFKLELFWSYRLAFAGKHYYTWEIIQNILLYMPLGFMLPAVFKTMPVWKMILMMLALSSAIECIQLVWRLGLFEFDDIFNNTLGGIIGLTIFKQIQRTREHVRKRQ